MSPASRITGVAYRIPEKKRIEALDILLYRRAFPAGLRYLLMTMRRWHTCYPVNRLAPAYSQASVEMDLAGRHWYGVMGSLT